MLEGYNAAVFAYGATGSGKTHTMLGPNPKKAATPASEQPPQTTAGGDGLMVKAIADIYKHIEDAENPEAYKVSQILFHLTLYCKCKPLHCKYLLKRSKKRRRRMTRPITVTLSETI